MCFVAVVLAYSVLSLGLGILLGRFIRAGRDRDE